MTAADGDRIIANTRSVQLSEKFHRELGEVVDLFSGRIKGSGTSDMPTWMVDRLDRAGWIDASTGAGRQARAARCPTCGGCVIRGLTSFPMAVSVDADPQPLTQQGEAVCLILGRATYELRYLFGGTYDLDHRDRWRRKERPAGMTKQVDTLARHICGKPPPPPHAATMLREPEHTDTPEEPPY